MEVSTFELLYKPLSPVGGAIARRVLQGYFLTITNLESADYLYRIDFNITLPNPVVPERLLDPPLALFISDVATAPDNVFATPTRVSATSQTYYNTFRIPAGKTALVVLLPNISQPNFFTAVPSNFEVRGYVTLSLPCVFRKFGQFYFYGPQSNTPVKVLLNAESRATYLPQNWPVVTTDLDFDQTMSALTLASGKGLNEVESSVCFFFPINIQKNRVLELVERVTPAGDTNERVAQLVVGLAELANNEESVKIVSGLLEELGVPLAVESRADRRGGK